MQAKLKELADYGRARHIRLYFAMTPDVHNLVDYKFGFVHDTMRRIAEADGYTYVDLLPAMRGRPPETLFAMPGDPHPNALGHQLMADAIFRSPKAEDVLFSSPPFFLFFALYFAFHLIVPARYRVYLIICGSTIFYAWWRIEYTWLPYALMAIAYGGVLWMERGADRSQRKRRATLAIVVLFVPLLFFKYTNFVYRDVLGPVFGWHGTLLHLPLPLGVSFITFTLTAYVVDIYRRTFRPSPSTVLAYVLFFPHLIAGPILRPHELIPQLDHPRKALLRRVAVPWRSSRSAWSRSWCLRTRSPRRST